MSINVGYGMRKLRQKSVDLLRQLFKNEFGDLADVGLAVGYSSDRRFIKRDIKLFVKRHKDLISEKKGKYFPTSLCRNTYLKDTHYFKEEENGELRELHKIEYNAFLCTEPNFDFMDHYAHKNNISEFKRIGRNGSIYYIKDYKRGFSARVYQNKRIIFHLLEYPQGDDVSLLMDYSKKEIIKSIKEFELTFNQKIKKDNQEFILTLQDTHLAFIKHPINIWMKQNGVKVKIKSPDGKYNDLTLDESMGVMHLETENKTKIVDVDESVNKLFSDTLDHYSMSENFDNIQDMRQKINDNELSLKDFIKKENEIVTLIIGDITRFKTEQLDRSEQVNLNLQKISVVLDNVMTRVNRVEQELNIR